MKEWVFATPDEALRDDIASRLDISPVTAALLLTRGVRTVQDARRFLKPTREDLFDPRLLPDIDKAVDTICRHAREGSRIVVYGDYDVDGLCAVTMLLQFLRLLGLDPSYYVPGRAEEGYGVHSDALEKLREEGAGLVVTVDCGISSVEESKLAAKLGLEMVITDHHEPSGELPEAAAVVNPKIEGSDYPFKELAGVGVAFKLVLALVEHFYPRGEVPPHFEKFLFDSMGLVAMGTIADVVPLLSENRILAKFGLEALQFSELPGVQALMNQCGLAEKPLDADSVSFKLGPRLNVAGRMASADIAMKLLMTDSYGEGERIARELERLNRERQQAQREITQTARQIITEELSEDDTILVLASENWSPGVIGIVASHLVEDFHRPAIMISLDGDIGRGSARSIPPLNIVEALSACSEHLETFGGHAQAAGLRIPKASIDNFRADVNAYASNILSAEDLRPRLDIDGEVILDSLSQAFVNELDRLSPFGQGAPEPVLVARGVRLAGRPRRVGSSGKHLAGYLSQGGAAFRCIAFGMGEFAEKLSRGSGTFDIAFTPTIETFTGQGNVELRIKDIRMDEEDAS